MRKTLQKFYFLFSLTLLLTVGFFLPLIVRANGSLEITFEKDPLFSVANFLPGDSTTGWVKIKNNTGASKSIFLWTANVSDPAHFGQVLNLKIKEGLNILYNNTLSFLFATSSVYLSDLVQGNQTQYDFILTFDILAGNEYQNKSLQMDLWLGTSPPEGEEPGAGEGIVLAVYGGMPFIPPQLTISNVQVSNITTNQANVTWQTNLFATSQVIYSVEGEPHSFDPANPPSYGYSHIYPDPEDSLLRTSHSVLLSGLQPCLAYYFRVVSHNSSIAISPENAFTTACLVGEVKEEIEKPKKEEKPVREVPIIEREKPKIEEKIPSAPPLKEIEKEKITEEKPAEKLLEEPAKEKPPFLANLLAAIGSAFEDLGKLLTSCYSSFPWWVILILALYPLIKGTRAWRRIEKEIHLSIKNYTKKEALVWLGWFLGLLILAGIFYFLPYRQVAVWVLFVLFLITFLLGFFLAKRKEKIVREMIGEKISFLDQLKQSPKFILIIGGFLILLIVWLIFRCWPLWLILVLLAFFIFGALFRRKREVTSPIFFLFIGLFITIFFAFFPRIYDPIIMKTLPLESIEEDKELVSYLASIQNQENIIVGVHGLLHRSPVSDKTICEYWCPGEEITFEMVKERVEKGVNIFKKAGLETAWIAPPGMSYDEKFLDITEEMGYAHEPYVIIENSQGFHNKLKMILQPEILPRLYQIQAPAKEIIFKEYTWEWRKEKEVSKTVYEETKRQLAADVERGINGLLFHVADYNGKTHTFVKEALQEYSQLKFVRIDDIVSNHDISRLEKLVNLATENNRLLFIAVIPAHLAGVKSLGLSGAIAVTWLVFIPFFLFPIAVMVPLHWYERGKVRRAKRKIPGSPKVSLILPAYNEEKFIEKSIKQALKQDYRGELEIIIIDDGSTDRTFEIAQKCAAQYPNVKIYQHDKNRGKPAALNTGFEKATGSISVFSDTDSHLDSDLVSRMMPHFDDPQVGLVAGMIIIDNEINLLIKLQQIEYLYNQEIIRFCQTTHKGVLICPGAATAVRTEIAREIPSTERTITEDADFTFDVAKAGWKVSQEPEAVSRTDAPENWKELLNQRKRWLYGVLQTIWLHKWALFYKNTKIPNLWVWWAWIGYITCPITTLAVVAIPLFIWLLGSVYLVFLGYYSLLIAAIFGFAHWYGIKQYTHERKSKLVVLLPIYMVYQYLLNTLLFYLVIAFILRRGITVRYGGRDIHAV